MTVEHFNEWYAAMDEGSRRDRLWQQFLGLPPELVSTSLLAMAGLREVADLLDRGAGGDPGGSGVTSLSLYG